MLKTTTTKKNTKKREEQNTQLRDSLQIVISIKQSKCSFFFFFVVCVCVCVCQSVDIERTLEHISLHIRQDV